MSKTFTLGLVVVIASVIAGCGSSKVDASTSTSGANGGSTNSEAPGSTSTTAAAAPTVPDAKDLKIADTKPGAGKLVLEKGDLAVVLYTGKLTNGKEFDSNARGTDKQPYIFEVGAGRVIAGWDQGVLGMKIGGKRNLVVPPSMGYGEAGSGEAIPGGATLVFDIELLEIIKKGGYNDYTKKIVKEGTGEPAKKGDTIAVHYTGTLLTGKKFDSSRDRNEPYKVTLGAGGVIKGWDIGLIGIKKGERRIMRLMPGAAYGERGMGQDIGPNQPLEFDIECVDITRAK